MTDASPNGPYRVLAVDLEEISITVDVVRERKNISKAMGGWL